MSVIDISQGIFPVVKVRKSHEVPLTFDVVNWNGVSMPKIQEPITVLSVTKHTTAKENWFSYAGFTLAVKARNQHI